jgi:hypothetical protein
VAFIADHAAEPASKLGVKRLKARPFWFRPEPEALGAVASQPPPPPKACREKSLIPIGLLFWIFFFLLFDLCESRLESINLCVDDFGETNEISANLSKSIKVFEVGDRNGPGKDVPIKWILPTTFRRSVAEWSVED